SRRRHTRFSRDWSSDVCSSDLESCFYGLCICSSAYVKEVRRLTTSDFDDVHRRHGQTSTVYHTTYVSVKFYIVQVRLTCFNFGRSEERRVGKEGSSRGTPNPEA